MNSHNPYFVEGFYNPEIQSTKEIPNGYPGNLTKEEFFEQYPEITDSIDATQFLMLPGDTLTLALESVELPLRDAPEEYTQWISEYQDPLLEITDEWNITIPTNDEDYLVQSIEIRKRRSPDLNNQLETLNNLYVFAVQNPVAANALRLKHNNLGNKWIEIVEHLIALDKLKSIVRELLADSGNIDLGIVDSAITQAFMRQVKLWNAQRELLTILNKKHE